MEIRKQLYAIGRSAPSRTLRDLKPRSLRSRRKNVAPGKRSETKWSEAPPGVPFGKGFLARFSGRQNDAFGKALAPAKAGLITNPLAYPGFRSLRSLHPGLNSAARFAGSLCGAALLVCLACGIPVKAQLARSRAQTGSRARVAGAPDAPRSLPSIHSRAEFDSLAVVYDANTPYALPHVLFVIDRRDKNRIYYVNTNRYKFHKDFVNGTYLSLERGQVFFENNYLKPNRRFIMGTVAYQSPVRRWTFEFWEGDLIPSDQIKLASDIINQTFFTPVAFKPNSTRQDEASAGIEGLQRVLQTEISRNQEYQPLNVAI